MKVLKRARAVLTPIAALYDRRLGEYGPTPRGVFWKTEEGQFLRFDVFMGAFETEADAGGITINDLGCGYGALFAYLKDMPLMRKSHYFGYDVSGDMVEAAKQRLDDPRALFVQAMAATRDADYSFVSGTYNMCIDTNKTEWVEYIKASLTHLWSRTHKAMTFNMLSTHRNKRLSDLYYADPAYYVDFCIRNLSNNVALLHDYSLAEWTIIVRR